MSIGHAIGVCVRMVKFCPGVTYCRYGKQDTIRVGRKLDELYHGYTLPAKFKVGVSGCENSCTAQSVKEIGLMGTSDGWTLSAGGTCGAKPRFGDVVAEGLTDSEAVDLSGRIIKYVEQCPWAKKMRLGRVIDQIGLDEFKKALQA